GKQSAFLRYVVEKYLAGEASGIKEYEIGTLVYQRSDDYDPREDPIVRVEASRLRARLREYYETSGKDDTVRIELPKGAYIPSFSGLIEPKEVQNDVILTQSVPPQPATEIPQRRFLWHWAAAILVLIAAGYWQFVYRPEASQQRRAALQRTFRQASHLHATMTPAAVREARLLHEAIVRSDPDWPLAHSGLSHVYISLISVGGSTREELGPAALAEARKSVALDPQLGDGHAALVRYYRDIQMDFAGVENACRTALEKAPDASQILVNCAPVQSLRNNHEIAELWARDAVRLNPTWGDSWYTQALVLWRAGRTAEAVAPAKRAVDVDTRAIGARAILAMIALSKGQNDEAVRVMEERLPTNGIDREEWFAYRGFLAASLGRKAEAERMYQELEQRSLRLAVSPVSFARIRMGERNWDAALTLLEEAARRRDVEAAMFLTSPEAVPLRENPRYQALAKAMGVTALTVPR
ncbi:MAG TPA: hypothetical protein VFQ91_08415, partial [Bryobacteraceae bacterium]|nr:hypothetical protein [Bryobacteraceae bacterium]